ncbi:MAG: type I-G CRISPR-associated protein Csb2 [Dermatophilaceae bacterium]
MATALGFRFPLGEYHATAWDRAVNSGESEWPPSSWRILRALLSTWHTRGPQFDREVVERVAVGLASEPPSYLLPSVTPSHTRHYLPGVRHTATVRDTAYTLAPRLQVDREAALLVLWPNVDLDADCRHVLGALLKAMPYLGRAESVCDARLLEPPEVPAVDQTWIVPSDTVDELRVLVPESGVTRAQLEVTPDAMRRARRLVPEGGRWQGYRRGHVPAPGRAGPMYALPTAVRWAVGGHAPIHERNGVLTTSGLRLKALRAIKDCGLDTAPDFRRLAGKHERQRADDGHRHAHWMWLRASQSGDAASRDRVGELALWVPEGIPAEMVAPIVGVGGLPRLGGEPKGYAPAPLYLMAVGRCEQVVPELTTRSLRWRTRTPMLTDRHPKARRSVDSFVAAELQRELSYRDWGEGGTPTLVSVSVAKAWEDREVTQYRRYRLTESMAERRRGFEVTFELDRGIDGPVSLGALSHFGFGLFEPV